jgi:hypothetical protein
MCYKLLIAVLFQPLRRRIQAIIDRLYLSWSQIVFTTDLRD